MDNASGLPFFFLTIEFEFVFRIAYVLCLGFIVYM